MFLVRLPMRLLGFVVRNWLSIAILFAIYVLFRITGWAEYFNNSVLNLGLDPENWGIAAIKLVALTWLISFLRQSVLGEAGFYGLVAIVEMASFQGPFEIPAWVLSCFIPQDMWGITFFAILAIYRLGLYFAPVEED